MKKIKCSNCGKTIRVQFGSIDEAVNSDRRKTKCVPSCSGSYNLCKKCHLTLKADSDCDKGEHCIKMKDGKCLYLVVG